MRRRIRRHPRHCWLRLKRHKPYRTVCFDLTYGWVWRCERCKYEVSPLTATDDNPEPSA